MPVIKASKKSMRQDIVRRARRLPLRNQLKTTYKKALELIKEGKVEEAKKFLSFAYKVIDTATKKHIIHPNNAARKKSLIARGLNTLEKKGGKAPEVTEKTNENV